MKYLLTLLAAVFLFAPPAHAWEVSFDPPHITVTRDKPFSVGLSILAEEADENIHFKNYGLMSYDWAVDGPYQVDAPFPLATCSRDPGTVEYCWRLCQTKILALFLTTQ
jgi:hypothetical protein